MDPPSSSAHDVEDLNATEPLNEHPNPLVGGSSGALTSSVSPSHTAGQGSQENLIPQPPKKKRKNASLVWDHFTKLGYNADPKVQSEEAQCDYCGSVLKSDSRSQGTTPLRKHLLNCKDYSDYLGINQKSQQTLTYQFGKASSQAKVRLGFSQNVARSALAQFLIMDELPFTTVEKPGFIKFMLEIEPRFKIPSRYTTMRDVMKIYFDKRTDLRDFIKRSAHRVCLTTDTWSSLQNITYMCVTAHFIDKTWNLQKKIMSFKKLADHSGEGIGQHLEDVLIDWSIDKILTVTVDNASANAGAIAYLKRSDVLKHHQVCNGDYMHVRCTAHIINLIVQEELKDIGDSVIRVRNAVKLVKSSSQRFENFKHCVTRAKITLKPFLELDVPTRWNSTYIMLDRAEKFENAFKKMIQFGYLPKTHLPPIDRVETEEETRKRKLKGPPTAEDWENARSISSFLGLFHDITKRVSGSLYATSNFYFGETGLIFGHIKNEKMSNDPSIANMAYSMQKKYDKYWGDMSQNRVLFLAAILDPRYKLNVLGFWFKNTFGEVIGEDCVSNLKNELYRIYDEYNTDLTTQVTQRQDPGRNASTIASRDEFDPLAMFLRQQSTNPEQVGEVDRYLTDRFVPPQQFDILAWWKSNSSNYKVLAKVARDVLAIPIKTVASESAFSTGGRILDEHRSSLAPKTAEALICAQDWLKPRTFTNLDCVYTMEDEMSAKLDEELENDSELSKLLSESVTEL